MDTPATLFSKNIPNAEEKQEIVAKGKVLGL
jgi:hypothetical protein